MKIQEYQTTQTPQAIKSQETIQGIMHQTQQYQYGTNQILQKPENTKMILNSNMQAPIQNTINPYFQQQPLIPLPPVNYEYPHFIKDFPIYESDPRYISRFASKKLYSQGNIPTKDTRLLGINQVAPIIQNVETVLNRVGGPEIKIGATGLNSVMPVVNQVGTGIIGLENATTKLNQTNTTVNTINCFSICLNNKKI